MDLIDRQPLKQALGINADDCDKCAWGYKGRCKRGSDFEDACCAIEEAPSAEQWIPVSVRLPDEEFVEGLENGTVYNLYPLLVTRYATHSPVDPKRLYVAKHYYDGNDFVNNGGEECTEAVIAWMPLPEPYAKRRTDG